MKITCIYAYAALVLGAVSLVGCSDFLEQKSPTEMTGDNVYENEYYTGQRVYNLYGLLTTDRTYSQDMVVTFCNNTDIECVDGMKKDDRHNAANYRGWGNYYAETFASDTKAYNMWSEFYGIIEDANLTIEGIENSTPFKNGDKNYAAFLGEALTMRAMIYLDLVRLWGDVPMKMETSKPDMSNVNTGKVDRDVILDRLIEDLDKAIEYLPWAGDKYTTERITKGFALGLQGQICLTRAGWAIREQSKPGYETAEDGNSDATYPTQRPALDERKAYYEKALADFSQIINSGKHQLNQTFHDQWYKVNQLTLDSNHENIFEIPMGLGISGEIGYSVGVRLNQQTATYGYTNSTGHMNLTAKHFYDYAKNDTRRLQTCCFYQIRSTAGSNSTKSGTELDNFIGNAPFAVACGKWDPRMMSSAWLNQNLITESKQGYGINYVRMRYPQVLLYYAECMNELTGDPDASYTVGGVTYDMTARQALLQVRKRAFYGNESEAESYVGGLNSSNFFDALVNENALEFAGEGVRKWDLIRWNLLYSKIMETRNATINRMQTTPEGNSLIWDETVAYNTKDDAGNLIDDSSYTFGTNMSKDDQKAAGYKVTNKKSFGTSDATQTNNAKYYCGGLCGSPDGEPAVKNRYLLPLPNMAISTNPKLSQSYGY